MPDRMIECDECGIGVCEYEPDVQYPKRVLCADCGLKMLAELSNGEGEPGLDMEHGAVEE